MIYDLALEVGGPTRSCVGLAFPSKNNSENKPLLIHERDAFVYFDESRCRGADMKFRTDARAALARGLTGLEVYCVDIWLPTDCFLNFILP